MAVSAKLSPDQQLADELAKYTADPLSFVHFAYPWGKPGQLRNLKGPDGWQIEALQQIGEEVRKRAFDGTNPVMPIRFSRASGHGIGKTTFTAWIVDWIMSTRPYARGKVTANKFTQLETTTWAGIQKWTKLCITGHWFTTTNSRLYHKQHESNWSCSAETCKEENSQAFAGQHASDSTSFYIFDEASEIPESVWEVAEGGLTDGEPMIFAFGNPTMRSGKFFRINFGHDRFRWNCGAIDSRSCSFTNKTQISEWIEDHKDDGGEDSDFVRVRVRGLPPRTSDSQYIPADLVYDAQKRPAIHLPEDPLVVGVDVARGGSDHSVICFRRGKDARSIRPIRLPGDETRDSNRLVNLVIDVLNREYDGVKPAVVFVDGTGIGGPIVDSIRQRGYRNVVEINFSWKAPDEKYANMRAYMWGCMREWLRHGAIPDDPVLETDLTGPGYKHKNDAVLLEAKEDMKKRGLDSPDDGDALALTFSQPVGPLAVQRAKVSGFERGPIVGPDAWMM